MKTDDFRLALVSTPRSGNSWLRLMLAQSLELKEVTTNHVDELNWDTLPARAILQTHRGPDKAFVSRLNDHGFRVIVLARHPLDVLISILAYSQHDNSTLQWLGGAGGNERSLLGTSPLSEAFLDYATGPRAQALLGVSVDWWRMPDVGRVRYEDLVSDTAGQLAGILATLDVSARRGLGDVVSENSPQEMRNAGVHWLYHVWQAQPGLWKRLLTAAEARRICEAQRGALETFGYSCEPDESLCPAEAQQAWDRIDAAAVKRSVNGMKKAFHEFMVYEQQQRLGLETLSRQFADFQLHQAQNQERQRAEIETLARQFSGLPLDQLRDLSKLGHWSLETAHALHRCSLRFPRLASGFKSLVLLGRRALSRLRTSGTRK